MPFSQTYFTIGFPSSLEVKYQTVAWYVSHAKSLHTNEVTQGIEVMSYWPSSQVLPSLVFWVSVCPLFITRLSGESPFQGESDSDTLARVTAAQLMFNPQSFEEISEQAKDFIKALIRKDSRWDQVPSPALCFLRDTVPKSALTGPLLLHADAGCPVARPSPTPGWLHLRRWTRGTPKPSPRRRWRSTWPSRSGRYSLKMKVAHEEWWKWGAYY